MTNLSPAAEAVLDAFADEWPWQNMPQTHESLAAALRAAATQVTPLSTNLRQNKIRYKLLAIADELEAMSN